MNLNCKYNKINNSVKMEFNYYYNRNNKITNYKINFYNLKNNKKKIEKKYFFLKHNKVNYKFNGALSLSYSEFKSGEREIPTSFTTQKNMAIKLNALTLNKQHLFIH